MDQNIEKQARENEFDREWKKKATQFISSQSLSMFGSMLVQYAIIWHITLTTQSGMILTISTLASFLPQILISLFAGVWADRYPRKLLIIGADVLTATSTLGLAIAFLLGYQELWLIFVVAAIRSVGAGIQMPAVNALLPQIVPTDQLMRVNSINATLQPFIMVITPILSGALLSTSRLEYIFFIDVVTAALAVGLLVFLRVPPLQKNEVRADAGYLDDLRAGLTYIAQHKVIRTLFIFFGFVFFLVTPIAFLTPLLVARTYGEEVWRLTANEVTFFVGSILGGFIMTAWGGFKNRFQTIGLSCILWAVLFSAMGLTRNFYLYLALMFLSGFPMPFFNAPTVTLLQEMVPQEIQGRVFSVQSLIMNVVMPIGMLIFGPLADVMTVESLLVISSALMAIPGVWIFFNRSLKIREAAEAAQADQAAQAEQEASGDYEMQPGD